jgi:chromosome segregation ATPase
MPGVYKEIRQLRTKVKAAKRAVREAQTLLATLRDECDDLLRAHAAMTAMRTDVPGSHPAPTKAGEEDRRRVATILAEVGKLETELGALLLETPRQAPTR